MAALPSPSPPPSSVWLGGFFNPNAFITATRQAAARANGWSVENMELVVQVLPPGSVPERGVDRFVVRGKLQSLLACRIFPNTELPRVNTGSCRLARRAVGLNYCPIDNDARCPVFMAKQGCGYPATKGWHASISASLHQFGENRISVYTPAACPCFGAKGNLVSKGSSTHLPCFLVPFEQTIQSGSGLKMCLFLFLSSFQHRQIHLFFSTQGQIIPNPTECVIKLQVSAVAWHAPSALFIAVSKQASSFSLVLYSGNRR